MEQNVAIKIYKAWKKDAADREKLILQRIGGGETDCQGNDRDEHNQPHEGNVHVAHLIDHFQRKGYNGMHLCLVMKPLGPSLSTLGLCIETETMLPEVMLPAWKQLDKATEYLKSINVREKKGETKGGFACDSQLCLPSAAHFVIRPSLR